MTEHNLAAILDVAVATVRSAGRLIMEHQPTGRSTPSYKDGVEPVTDADLLADAEIARGLRAAFPRYGILSEETAVADGWEAADLSAAMWVVDPIDGTANYAHGHPYVSISVAFIVDGTVEVGVVHAPFLGETFTAIRGQGARLNGHPIRTSVPDGLHRAVISTGFPHRKGDLTPLLRRIELLLTHCQDIRRGASPALDICWVAAGRLDAHTETLHPWDVAASALIAQEAGAVRSHLELVPAHVPPDLFGGGYLVSAAAIHDALVDLLTEGEGVER
ncbi:inositol monophosphatase [Streptomyces sp. NBC_01321]|uniref:inositol monophosphatase family protein n=1 Tax=Streptomyces sp. NBC_01321 TaxID=2903825 RepID=UPI002E10737D|nr:inositol monophosphatase [Streptomyces sp. NBC_01321]